MECQHTRLRLGIAQSNVLVTVTQNNSIIYQTTVAPGPFSLTDVYPSGYGNDLVVTVKKLMEVKAALACHILH